MTATEKLKIMTFRGWQMIMSLTKWQLMC